MDKIYVTKSVVRAIVGSCTAWTVNSAIRNNVSVESKADKVKLFLGTATVGAIVSDAAGKRTDKLIDELTAAFRTAKEEATEVKTQLTESESPA